MTDKEFKKLNRSQLIDIIYELQLKQEELTAENKKLSEELADKRIRTHEQSRKYCRSSSRNSQCDAVCSGCSNALSSGSAESN